MDLKLITALLVWFLSLGGILWIFWKKLPVLAELKVAGENRKDLSQRRGVRAIFLSPLKNFSPPKLAEKSLAKLHIFILKTENSVRVLRERLHHNSSSKKQEGEKAIKDSSYWEILKKK